MQIREPRPDDEPAWRQLWAAYVRFYESDVPDDVTATTWRRALEPDSGVIIRLADATHGVVGFSASIIHPGTWTAAPICYLEDLYVDATVRGQGIGRALIDDLLHLGQDRGWSRLYWHTMSDNAAARRLYDRYADADGFVRYRLFL